jgi:hypothetical protein
MEITMPLANVKSTWINGNLTFAQKYANGTAIIDMDGVSIQANNIADPGDAAAIPVTQSGTVAIVTGGAETRTLAAPSYVGQELLLYMKTDLGDCVIAIATGINQTGNNRITLNDAGDTVLLRAIESGANLRWRVVANDGATLATV